MESRDKKHPAPALARGLALLRLLGDGRKATLDELARETSWPKPSLLRLLQTLQQVSAVGRELPSRRFYATAALVPLVAGRADFDARLIAALQRLAAATGHTAEWYLPTEAGMVLTCRAEPAGGEVRVRARLGFVRPWDSELDAVAAVGIALFRPRQRSFSGYWSYAADAVRGRLKAAEARERVTRVRRDGLAADSKCNTHGVRRIAAVALYEGAPAGVLALAQHLVPGGRRQDRTFKKMLQAEARWLGRQDEERNEP